MKKAMLIAAVMVTLSTAEAAATQDFCAVVLRTPDGFLALRSGPGTKFKMVARLRRGDTIYADTRQCMGEVCADGKWIYVNHVPSLDGHAKKARHFTQGWVARRYVQTFGGTDMPCSAAYEE